MLDASSDEALALGFAAHQQWAFDEAYLRYATLLYNTAYNVLGNPEDARDCVHDALARVWKNPNAYATNRGAVRSFLVVCVRNEAISRARSQARRTKLTSRLAAEPVEHDYLPDSDPIERDRLRSAFAKLPNDQKRALELAYYGGLSHTEVAKTLNQPLGTVKSRIAMGLRKLGEALGR